MERGNLRLRCERKSHKWKNHEDESTDAQARGGTARSSNEVCDKQMERRGGVMEPSSTANQRWEELMNEAKPFEISKREIWEAYRKVKGNKGAAGVDGQTGNRLEKLGGDRRGQYSIRINDQWRICFRWRNGPWDVEIADYH